jgi:hypothetical protein
MIVAEEISVEELPGEFDESRTFHLRHAQLQDPERLLRELWAKGIRPTRAWQPLDNPMCMDPLGPTFTVELELDDQRILAFNFERGVGRLYCATRLTAYVIVEEAATRQDS